MVRVIKKEVHYIPSFGHLRYDLLQNIVDNPEYKKLAVNILRQFNDSIADICYTKADDGSYLETIITKKGVNMPFSVYGEMEYLRFGDRRNRKMYWLFWYRYIDFA